MKKILLMICLFLSFCFTCNAEVKSGSVEAKYEYTKDSKFYKTEIKDKKAKILLEDYQINFTSDKDNLNLVVIPIDKEKNNWIKDMLKDQSVDKLYYINIYDKDGNTEAKGIYFFKDNNNTKYIKTNEKSWNSVKYSDNINISLKNKELYIIKENIESSPKTSDNIIIYISLGVIAILGIVLLKKFLKK